MSQEKQLEGHLQELIQDKPSSRLKLCYIWDDLSVETQIKIFFSLKYRVPNSIRLKALNNSNDYLRYLVARSIGYGSFDEYASWLCFCAQKLKYEDYVNSFSKHNPELTRVLKKLFCDKSAMVRDALENCFGSLHPFGLVHPSDMPNMMEDTNANEQTDESSINGMNSLREERLARFSPGNFYQDYEYAWIRAEDIVGFIKQKNVSEHEISELIEEFFKNNGTKEFFNSMDMVLRLRDGERRKKAFRMLWDIIPELGSSRVAFYLISYLPAEACGVENVPSEELLLSIDNNLLKKLFYREDVNLRQFRKKMFFSSDDEEMQRVAASHNFDLDYAEFDRLLKTDRKRLKQVVGADGISPIYLFALDDLAHCGLLEWGEIRENREKKEKEICEFVKGKSEFGLRDLKIYDQLRQLAIYSMAKMVVPWEKKSEEPKRSEEGIDRPKTVAEALRYILTKSLQTKLAYTIELLDRGLNDEIVLKDTWSTFMKFSSKIYHGMMYVPLLELLPYVLPDAKLAPREEERLFSDLEFNDKIFTEEKINAIFGRTKDLSEQNKQIGSILSSSINNVMKDMTMWMIIITILVVLSWMF